MFTFLPLGVDGVYYGLKSSILGKNDDPFLSEEVLVEFTYKQNQGSIVLLSMGKFQAT
jgi:hypothetical protein